MIASLDDMLYRDEDKRNVAYPDSLTGREPWTIGRGHTGPEVHEGLVWTDAQVEAAYQADKAGAIHQVDTRFPWVRNLNEPRKAVLYAMCFQMGPTRLSGFVRMLDAAHSGDFKRAASEMAGSIWARQTPKRCVRMADQMETGEWR